MFDIGWTEMLVIAIVMIVVVGPKDLPRMLRTFGRTTSKLRSMAGDFQRQFNEALREAELDDVRQSVDELRQLNPASQVRKHLNPFEQAASEVRAGLNSLKPGQPAAPATPVPQAVEPAKNGTAAIPGETPPTSSSPASADAAQVAPSAGTAASAVAGSAAATVAGPEAKKATTASRAKTKAAGPATTRRAQKAVKPDVPDKAAAAPSKPRRTAAKKADTPS